MKEVRKFKLSDLFELQQITKKLSKEKLINFSNFPVYSSDTSNNGIIGYIDKPDFNCDKENLYIIFGDHTRAFHIADKGFSVLDNVKVLKPKFVPNYERLLYVITIWHKSIQNLGYARHWKLAKESVAYLPVITDEQGIKPDWTYMENYIKAIEKVVIRDVVKWKDIEIEKTKEVIVD